MKIILCGYQWVGCRALSILRDQGHEIFVFTHEPKDGNPDLAALCKKYSIPYSTNKITLDNLPFKPDIICSIYYRYIIGPEVIRACGGRIFNMHPSLLPKYRGCSSIPWAIINGEDETGFTFHYIDEKIDTGKILLQKPISIYPWDTQTTLSQRIMFASMESFPAVLELVKDGFEGKPQVGAPTYYKRGCPFDAKIDPTWDTDKVDRFIRAMIFPPLRPATIFGKDVLTLDEYKKIMDSR